MIIVINYNWVVLEYDYERGMVMRFCLEGNELVRLVGLKNIKTKTGNTMCFATVTGKESFLSGEFALDTMASPAEALEVHKDYNMVLDVDGKYSKIVLIPLVKKWGVFYECRLRVCSAV